MPYAYIKYHSISVYTQIVYFQEIILVTTKLWGHSLSYDNQTNLHLKWYMHILNIKRLYTVYTQIGYFQEI
ncbi:hypothetical protein Avbf_13766 [Armadillidium vulgare]|nr:hypothetical protein Avbf_13766 [Armadillidium vulgare]